MGAAIAGRHKPVNLAVSENVLCQRDNGNNASNNRYGHQKAFYLIRAAKHVKNNHEHARECQHQSKVTFGCMWIETQGHRFEHLIGVG